MADRDPLVNALRQLTGNSDASFRDGQREAIEALVDQRARVLVVQRTGWGKSAVYFLATHLLRKSGLGPTLLISPLLALMRNQIDAARRLGLRCETINSADATTVTDLEQVLRKDAADLIIISPERLANPEFGDKVMPLIGARPGLIVIDEVHCISDWGHDFRPDYRRIGRIFDRLAGSKVPILGCTATANDRVASDVADQLGAALTTFRGPLRRDGLALSALQLDRQAERLGWLAVTVPELEGSGIVYCLTVSDTDSVAAWLSQRGIAARAYHGGIDNDERLVAEQQLRDNEIKVLVATTALGMGYDKPDLSFVIHFQSPSSPVAYYQQVGRAGRGLRQSIGVILRGTEDEKIQDYFIERAFAPEPLVNEVVAAFDSIDGPVSLSHIQSVVNVKLGMLELVVKQLDVDGALRRVGYRTYERTLQPWSYPTERVEMVTEARRSEQQSMIEYLHSAQCRMRFIANLLDDPSNEPCGICDNCAGSSLERAVPTRLIAQAERFLARRPLPIAAKKMAVTADGGTSRRIPNNERIEEGRVLSTWGDAGWGQLVRTAKYAEARFDDQLVDALVELVQQWNPQPKPTWVTCVPSIRYPDIVPDLARRVAKRLGLRFVAAVARVQERPPQRDQQNSAHQQRNVQGAFAVTAKMPDGPVLIIDDLVNSGWTLTEVGRVLRRAGAGVSYPVALAYTGGRD